MEGRLRHWPRPADPARVPRRGVALRARAGAARTAVPAPPPQSAPRSARTCRRAALPRAPRPAPLGAPPRRAIARGRRRSRRSRWSRRSRGSRRSRRAEARASHPGLPLRQPLRRRHGPGTPGWGSPGLVQASLLLPLQPPPLSPRPGASRSQGSG